MNSSMGCMVPYLICNYCDEQYTDMADTTSMCSTCGGYSYCTVSSKEEHMQRCIENLKVGDSAVVKLLPYNPKYHTFVEPITFPIIGLDRNNVPVIGTMSRELYYNHHFITSSGGEWRYHMSLDVKDILIERIIKGPPLPRWRVGKSLGRTLYIDDKCIGMVDTPELAASIVAAMNK